MNPITTIRRSNFALFFTITLFLISAKLNSQTIIATDGFDRADEIPFTIGVNWQNPFSGGIANLIGNQVAGNSGEALYYWQGTGSFDNTRQYAKARVVQASGQVGLILLGGSGHAIVVAWNSGTLYIYRYSGGSYQGNLTTVSSTIQNGDIIEGVLDNGVVYAKINGIEVASVANTTGITTGTPGFEFYQSGAIFDDWEAGTPASSSYSISGNISEGGLGLNGVLITASGGFSGNATTDVNGNYTITNVTSGATSVLLTPTLSGHTMSPLTQSITGPINSNITGQDFTSTLNVNNTLTITAINGTVIKDPDQATYSSGTNVTLTATADIGYHFLGWSGDATGSTNPLTVTMNGNKNIKANFLPLNVIAFDDFNRPNESPFVTGGNWQNIYNWGNVNLSGNQVAGNSGEALYYWNGIGTFDNTRQFARARVVNANGQVGLILLGGNNQALNVSWNTGTLYIYWYLNGSHQGELAHVSSIIHDGDIIEAVLDGGIIYVKINGAIVHSVPNTTSLTSGKPGFEFYQGGAIFDDWEAGTPASSSYSISGNITEGGLGLNGVLITASGGFSGNATTDINGDYTISNVTSGATSVLLTPTLSGHTMSPLTRSITGPINSNITGQDFTSTINVNNTLTITAINGTVIKDPDQATYSSGTNVTLTATADIGYHFLGWSGDATGSTNPLTVTMNGNKNIKANFLLLDVIAFDDFDRANESPFLINGNWRQTTSPGYPGYSILSSHHVISAVGEGIYYWQGAGAGSFLSTSQYARERVVQKDGEVGLVLLGGSDQAIMVGWGPPGVGSTVYIYWYSNGIDRGQLATGPSSLVNGDLIEAVLDGGTIYAKVNGITVLSVANTTTLTSGTPGFITYKDGNQLSQISILDDWEAGTPPLSSYTITASAGAGGVISPTGSVNVNSGSSQTFTITPNLDYHIADVLVDGISVGAVSSYIFNNVTANHTISTSFTINTYTLTITSVHGTVTKNPDQANYNHSSTVQLTATPSAGFIFTGWSGDATGSNNPLSVTMDGNKNITANFAIDNSTYIIIGSCSANAGASITIPISVHFGTDANIPQYILQGKIIFDPTKLSYRSNSVGALFTLMGWTFTGYSTTAGQFDFTATGYNLISTDGILFNLTFDVISNSNGSTHITSLPSYWLSNNSNTPALFSAINPGTINITSQSTSIAFGDVDENFNVNFNDAVAIINHVFNVFPLHGQALLNADVDHNGNITLADAVGVILYSTFGDWSYSLSILLPLTNAYLSIENPVINNKSVVLPLNIKNADNVRSLEVTVEYDPTKFSYESFSAGINSSNTITKASLVSPGQAKFIFASNKLMKDDFTAGSITLKTKNGTLVNGGSIKTSYKINDGKEVAGTSINTGVTDIVNDYGNGIPTKFELIQNYPNPFNPTTVIDFRIPINGYYVVKVFNAIGQTVSVLAERDFSVGNYKVTFDGNNLSSGIYFYQLFGNRVNLIRKMMLIK